jgi:hypothetical protein
LYFFKVDYIINVQASWAEEVGWVKKNGGRHCQAKWAEGKAQGSDGQTSWTEGVGWGEKRGRGRAFKRKSKKMRQKGRTSG